jgi:hypothetical protein
MVTMRYYLSGKVALKSQNDLIIFPIALRRRHVWGICSWDPREFSPFHISQSMSQLCQSHRMEKFISGVTLKAVEVV